MIRSEWPVARTVKSLPSASQSLPCVAVMQLVCDWKPGFSRQFDILP